MSSPALRLQLRLLCRWKDDYHLPMVEYEEQPFEQRDCEQRDFLEGDDWHEGGLEETAAPSCIRIHGLIAYTCQACAHWFALPAETPNQQGHPPYFCPDCECSAVGEGLLFGSGFLIGREDSPLLIATSTQGGGHVLRKRVQIGLCPVCQNFFLSAQRRSARRLFSPLRARPSQRSCPHCSSHMD